MKSKDLAYEGKYKKGHFTRAQIKGKDGTLYMDRWYILHFPRLFSIRIHHICSPDLDVWPHDHPWWFLSVILRGGYVEHVTTPRNFTLGYGSRHIRRFNFKSNTDLHKIVSFDRPGKGAWTLVITGPEKREWGFMTDEGWVSRVDFGLGASNGPEPA